MTLEELEERHKELSKRTEKNFEEAKKIAEESKRVAEVAENTPKILRELDEEFSAVTKLDSIDVSFLFVATALQIVRQYLLTSFPERMDDKQAAKNTKGHDEEHSDRKHRYYSPSVDEIITNPVPFDAITGSNGALSGGGKLGHRVTALGHDPILGLVVGTCNIATSTLTTNKLESFHICTGQIYNGQKRDVFGNRAITAKVLEKSADKLVNQGMNGKMIMGTSLLKELVHLNSDIDSKISIPIPIVSVIDGQLASKLAGYGLDMANVKAVTKQAMFSILINAIIAMIHGLFEPDNISKSLYEAKTRKILSYSNIIASTSNLIYVGANVAGGNEEALRKLDIGGLIVTCYRVATDARFIAAAKREFIDKRYFEMIRGEV